MDERRVGKFGEANGSQNSPARGGMVRSIQALESLKNRLLADQLTGVESTELRRRLSRAADDSASLAWATAIPLLALPELLAEKAHEAFRQFNRQQAIRTRGRTHNSLIQLAA